jgi:hypothetical protein
LRIPKLGQQQKHIKTTQIMMKDEKKQPKEKN